MTEQSSYKFVTASVKTVPFLRSLIFVFSLTLSFLPTHPVLADEITKSHSLITLRTNDNDVQFTVELSKDPTSRRLGLMHRETLAPGHGMLFIYPSRQPRAFWMKNTLIPLDVIFIDSQGRVINIEAGTPMSLKKLHSKKPAQFVLEINYGESEQHQIIPGSQLLLDRLDRTAQ